MLLKQKANTRRAEAQRLADQLVQRGDQARDGHSWALAAASYAGALNIDPSRTGIWVQHGHALKELGSLWQGETSYRRALSLEPKLADSHLQLGHVLKLQGRIREAAESYLVALRIEPFLSAAQHELMSIGFAPAAISESVESGVLPGRPYLEDRPTKLWQTIADNLQRIRIERGWLYRTCILGSNDQVTCAMTFVPD